MSKMKGRLEEAILAVENERKSVWTEERCEYQPKRHPRAPLPHGMTLDTKWR